MWCHEWISDCFSPHTDHSALSRWLPLVKKGGYFAFVHKASVWPKWTEEQDRLETSGVWRSVWTSKSLPFLPSLDGSGSDKAKIFIYQKLWTLSDYKWAECLETSNNTTLHSAYWCLCWGVYHNCSFLLNNSARFFQHETYTKSCHYWAYYTYICDWK